MNVCPPHFGRCGPSHSRPDWNLNWDWNQFVVRHCQKLCDSVVRDCASEFLKLRTRPTASTKRCTRLRAVSNACSGMASRHPYTKPVVVQMPTAMSFFFVRENFPTQTPTILIVFFSILVHQQQRPNTFSHFVILSSECYHQQL